MNQAHYTTDHAQAVSNKSFEAVTRAFEDQLNRWDPQMIDALAAGEDASAVKARIEAIVPASGFVLFSRIDHGAVLRLVGQSRKAVQYIVGNPLFAMEMTRHDLRAALYAPLRVLIYEKEMGKTCVEYDTPSSQFGQFGDARVLPTATMLDEKLAAMVKAALR